MSPTEHTAGPDPAPAGAACVFHGSSVEGREVSLVLDAKGIAYERIEAGGECTLLVAASAAGMAREELARYAAERAPPREPGAPFVPFRGSAAAAGAYAGVLILVAYCAGIQLFGVDWFDAGALQSTPGAPAEWWRTITALTLHLDQEHLMGNLLFGAGIGLLAGRVFGPGFAWLSMLAAGAAGNALEMWVSPAGHRAVGASTAVFAALGLLAGFGWGQRTAARDRRLYRWAPLFGGVCLLALLGAGTEHVDVLGHMLGFTCGILLGWLFARLGWPPRGSAALQPAAGALALLLVGAAWAIAIR